MRFRFHFKVFTRKDYQQPWATVAGHLCHYGVVLRQADICFDESKSPIMRVKQQGRVWDCQCGAFVFDESSCCGNRL